MTTNDELREQLFKLAFAFENQDDNLVALTFDEPKLVDFIETHTNQKVREALIRQMEVDIAYKNQCVREALEEARKRVYRCESLSDAHKAMGDMITTLSPQKEGEV